MRCGVCGIEGNSLLAVFLGACVRLWQIRTPVMPGFEQRLVSRNVGRVPVGLRGELQLQGRGDGLGDIVLDGEDVGELPIVALGPEVITVRCVNQLRGYAYTASRASDASFQNRSDT